MSAKPITPESIEKFMAAQEGFESVLKKVKIISVGNGDCVAELEIEKEHSNPLGTLHGGLIATIVDVLTTCGLFTHESCTRIPSVSVDLHITFIKGAAVGEKVIIDSKSLKVGNTLAYLSCEIKSKATGDILATGSHTKYILRGK